VKEKCRMTGGFILLLFVFQSIYDVNINQNNECKNKNTD
jgi:hypothetical protein